MAEMIHVAVLPWRDRANLRVLLVRKSGDTKWSVPQCSVNAAGNSHRAAARQECLDTVGACGSLSFYPVGEFQQKVADVDLVFQVIALQVNRLNTKYLRLESHERAWFTVKEAARQVDHEVLCDLILALPVSVGRSTRKVPAPPRASRPAAAKPIEAPLASVGETTKKVPSPARASRPAAAKPIEAPPASVGETTKKIPSPARASRPAAAKPIEAPLASVGETTKKVPSPARASRPASAKPIEAPPASVGETTKKVPSPARASRPAAAKSTKAPPKTD